MIRDNCCVKSVARSLLLSGLLLTGAGKLFGQSSDPTAIRRISPSAFGLFSGVYTGVGGSQTASTFDGGRNLGITAGVDLSVASFSRYVISAEARGTYPVAKGTIVAEKSVSVGGRISREPLGALGIGGRFRPYVDGLIGRGQMNYQRGGYVVDRDLLYTQTASWVYGGGGGVEYDLTRTISAKLDVQAQHWSTPVVNSGSVIAFQAGAGVAYRFGGGSGPR
jgi:hypothetical protein